MPVYKDKNGTWYVMTRCDDRQGKRKQKCKRGFKTKREAQDWERRFMLQQGGDLDMLFKAFYKLYEQDMKARLKQNTWEHKACVIKSKILPYFGEKSMKDIQARDVLTWQNELLRHRDKHGKNWSELTTFFEYPQEIRKIIYTTNAVESYHRMVRKFTKSKAIFPTDDSIRKIIYMSVKEISKKWTMPVRDWGLAYSQLAIFFEDRFTA